MTRRTRRHATPSSLALPCAPPSPPRLPPPSSLPSENSPSAFLLACTNPASSSSHPLDTVAVPTTAGRYCVRHFGRCFYRTVSAIRRAPTAVDSFDIAAGGQDRDGTASVRTMRGTVLSYSGIRLGIFHLASPLEISQIRGHSVGSSPPHLDRFGSGLGLELSV